MGNPNITFNYATNLDGVQLVNAWPEVVRVSPKCDIQRFQEFIHAIQQ